MMNIAFLLNHILHHNSRRQETPAMLVTLRSEKDAENRRTRHRGVELLHKSEVPKSIGEFRGLDTCQKIAKAAFGVNLLDIEVERTLGRRAVAPRQNREHEPAADILLDVLRFIIEFAQLELKDIGKIECILRANKFRRAEPCGADNHHKPLEISLVDKLLYTLGKSLVSVGLDGLHICTVLKTAT